MTETESVLLITLVMSVMYAITPILNLLLVWVFSFQSPCTGCLFGARCSFQNTAECCFSMYETEYSFNLIAFKVFILAKLLSENMGTD